MLRLDWEQDQPNTNHHQALPGQFVLISISPAFNSFFFKDKIKIFFQHVSP